MAYVHLFRISFVSLSYLFRISFAFFSNSSICAHGASWNTVNVGPNGPFRPCEANCACRPVPRPALRGLHS